MNDDLLNNLKKLKDLYDSGAITKEEFEELKSEYMRNKTVNIQHKKPIHKIDHRKDDLISGLNLSSLVFGAIPCVFWAILGHYVFFPVSTVVMLVLLLISDNISKKRGYIKGVKTPLIGCAIASVIIYSVACIIFLYVMTS